MPPGLVNLGPLSRVDLARTLRQPASTVGLAVDGPLVEVMLDRVCGPESLPELLAESDFIVLAAPLTPETENMINEETLRLVKPVARLINVARGRLVDEIGRAHV